MMGSILKKKLVLPPVDEAEVLRYLKVKKPDEGLEELLLSVLSETEGIFTSDVVYADFPLCFTGDTADIGFTKVVSRDLKKCMSDCRRAIVFTATIGHKLDRLIRRYSAVNPTRALVLQSVGTERVEVLCDAFCQNIKEEGKSLTPRFSPGYGDLPLSLQSDIFRALDTERKLGVTLTDSLLMLPTKTVSAIIGVG